MIVCVASFSYKGELTLHAVVVTTANNDPKD